MINAMFYALLDELLRDVGTVVTAAEFALPEGLDQDDADFLRSAACLMEAIQSE